MVPSAQVLGSLVEVTESVRNTIEKALTGGPMTPTALVVRLRELDPELPAGDIEVRDLVWELIYRERIAITPAGLLEWVPEPVDSHSEA